MRRALVMVAVMLGALAITPSAHADDLVCTTAIVEGTVDDVIVPAGAICFLYGTIVLGNVDVNAGSILISSCSSIAGNVMADGADDVVLACSTVGGRVQVVRGREGFIDDSTVSGDVLFAMNDGRVEIVDSVFSDSLRAHRNAGGVKIKGNRVAGDLRCSRNNPRPIGSDNLVEGTKSGQCRMI